MYWTKATKVSPIVRIVDKQKVKFYKIRSIVDRIRNGRIFCQDTKMWQLMNK